MKGKSYTAGIGFSSGNEETLILALGISLSGKNRNWRNVPATNEWMIV